jgi:hypothetical protein
MLKEIHLPKRLPIIFWLIILLFALFFYLRNYNSFQIGAYKDDAHYTVLAESIVKAEGYRLISRYGEEEYSGYPIGYPLILSSILRIFPDNFTAIKFVSLIATIINGSILFWFWHKFIKHSSEWWGLVISGLYLLAPIVISQTRMVMSEPIFTTFTLLSIVIAETILKNPNKLFLKLLLSLLLFFTLFTRTIGIALVIAVLLYLYWKHLGWKNISLIIGGMMILLALVLMLSPISLINVIPGNYINSITVQNGSVVDNSDNSLIIRVSQGIKEYSQSIIRTIVLPIGGGESEKNIIEQVGLDFLPTNIIGYLISFIVLLGLINWIGKDGFTLPIIYTLLYLVVLLFWPWRDQRFLYPIQPFLIYSWLLGAEKVLTLLPKNIKNLRNYALIPIILVLLFVYIYKALPLIDTSLQTQTYIGDLQARSEWLVVNADSSAIVMTEEPEIDYLYSRLLTVPYGTNKSLNEMKEYLIYNKVTYLIVAPTIGWEINSLPKYSEKTKMLLLHMDELIEELNIKLVHSSEQEEINIYKVMP